MASRTKKPVKTPVKAKAPAKAKTSASSRTQGKSPVKPATKAATKSKPVTKAAAPRKVSNVKKPAASRETLANLRAHVDALEARLKRANSLTQSSVKAMQTAFTKLNERSAQAGAAQEKEIVEYVEALNVHLTGLIDKTREDVAHDLKIVLDDPRVETISEALTKANHRITRAEFDQAGALTSINEQIASLATVVDRRLRRETEERERNQNLLSSKIEAVEKSSAQAVSSIGEKIVTLTGELNKRTDHRISALKSEISDADQSYQKEIEDHKSEIGRRMEALEDDQRNSIPSIERRLVTIASRMESLETDRFNVERAPQIAAPAFEAAPTLAPDAFTPQHTEAYDTITPPAQNMQLQNPQPAPMPASMSNMAVAMEAQPAPLQSEEPVESHIPQEYVPQEYVQPTYPAQEYATPEYPAQDLSGHGYGEPVYPAQETGMVADSFASGTYDPTPAPIMADAGAQPGTLPPPPFTSEIPLMPLPEQTMDEARPGSELPPQKAGGFLQKLKGGASGSALSGSPVKLFALMTGIAVIGLFAAQKLMPGPNTSNPQADIPRIASTAPIESEFSGDPAFVVSEPTPPVIESMDVVGDYSNEMQAPEIEPEANGIPSPAQLTLESAASNGDEVAQFQLGLSHLEAGRNAEAVRLIRLSANQGQAAAQYRLAKLYENGVGVEKDLSAAMKLLERSAKGGNRIAMHDLGHYYATGAATSQPEISKAVTWFQQAAERGVLDSQFNLGVLYQEGSGVPKSEIEAYVWYTIAGAQGDTMAVQRADILAREMSEPQIEQAKSRVKAYVPARIDDAANGVFGKLPWAKPATDRMARVNTDVKKAQQLLSDLGYNVGAPDGAIGPKTRNAIITFEKSNGLPQTGRVSAELMDRLSLAAGV